MEELKDKLHGLVTEGEIKLDGGKLSWYYTETIIDPDELYSISCEQADIVRKAGCETENSWSDNDSCGFDILAPQYCSINDTFGMVEEWETKPFCEWLRGYPMK